MSQIKMTVIALIALASSAGAPTAKAQEEEQENFVWITNTNGMTWKGTSRNTSRLSFNDSDKPKVAQIVVPEHASFDQIDVRECVNLTNLVFRPPSARRWHHESWPLDGGVWRNTSHLTIHPTPSLRTIAMRPEMIQRTNMDIEGQNNVIPAWLLTIEWTTNWQVGDPPKMEIRTTTTARGKEVEVVWRTGKLQIADAVSGEWKDYNGSSPLRFPLINPFAHPKDMQFFRIKPEEEEEPEDNQGTPTQPEK